MYELYHDVHIKENRAVAGVMLRNVRIVITSMEEATGSRLDIGRFCYTSTQGNMWRICPSLFSHIVNTYRMDQRN